MSIPEPVTGDLVTIQVISEGRTIDDTIKILSMEVMHSKNEYSIAVIRMLDGDVGDNQFAVTDSEVYSIGHHIDISAGYHSKNTGIFKGVVTSVTLDISQDKSQGSAPIVSVYCENITQDLNEWTLPSDTRIPIGAPDLELKFGKHVLEFSGDYTEQGLFGTVKMPGYAKVKVGQIVKLSGLGDRYSQNYSIVEISHEIGEGIWTTDLNIERSSS